MICISYLHPSVIVSLAMMPSRKISLPKQSQKGLAPKCPALPALTMTLQKILDTNFGLFEHREYSTTVPKNCYLKEKHMINHWILASKF